MGRLSGVLGGRRVDEELLEELEEILFTADLGVATAESLLDRIRSEARGQDGESVRALLEVGDPREARDGPGFGGRLLVAGASRTWCSSSA